MAQQRILACCHRLGATEVDRDAALGLVAAETVTSPCALPRFANSQMDGYAVRSADTTQPGAQLRVVGTIFAGAPASVGIERGHAARIMTGAAMPAGADAVCPLEEVEVEGHTVTIMPKVAAQTFVRQPGEDIAHGAVVLEAGCVIGAVEAGLLHAVGIERITVVRRPRVGVLSTGDELVDRGTLGDLSDARIYDANRTVLRGLLAENGCDVVDLGIVPDDEHAVIARIMDAAPELDALLTTGGVSVGDRDVIKGCLSSLRTTVSSAIQIAIKPGKPQVFAVLEDTGTVLFGLPGNPVSAAVTFELFVRPALRRMAGHDDLFRPIISARAATDFARHRDAKLHLRPATLTAGTPPFASTTGRTGSHMLSALHGIDGLALLPDGDGVVAGDEVAVMVLRESALLSSTDPDIIVPWSSLPGWLS